MGSEIPSYLLPVMVRTLMLNDGDPKLKNNVLQHLLSKCIK